MWAYFSVSAMCSCFNPFSEIILASGLAISADLKAAGHCPLEKQDKPLSYSVIVTKNKFSSFFLGKNWKDSSTKDWVSWRTLSSRKLNTITLSPPLILPSWVEMAPASTASSPKSLPYWLFMYSEAESKEFPLPSVKSS